MYYYFSPYSVMQVQSGAYQSELFNLPAKQDHLDRATKRLEAVLEENKVLQQQIRRAEQHPLEAIRPLRDSLALKINRLRDENEALREMVQQSKAPRYSQMSRIVSQSRMNLTDTRGGQSELATHFDKNDAASTCQNDTRMQDVCPQSETQMREELCEQIRTVLRESAQLQASIEKLVKQERTSESFKKRKLSGKEKEELQRASDCKKKLMRLLAEMKRREADITEMVAAYREIYEQTMIKYKSAQETLEQINQTHISEDIDERYAQVLDLEQQLQTIQKQLHQLDRTQWLQQIIKELERVVVERMQLQLPRCNSNKQYIDQLCELILECYLSSKRDTQTRNNLLKQYLEEEKKANLRTILSLKAKEQALGRKLIDLQMKK